MTEEEKKEIEQLPEKYRPLGAWGYFGYSILFSLPIAGLIFLIVFALDNVHNINRRNFARSAFCVIAIVLVTGLLTLCSLANTLSYLF